MRRFWLVVGVVGVLTVPMSAAAFSAASNHDKTIAQAGVLTLPDFPPGWTAMPPSGGDSDNRVETKLVSSIPQCRPFVPLIANARESVRAVPTSDFTDTATTVTNDVRVYPSAPKALKALTVLQGPALSACFQPLLDKALKAQLVKAKQASTVRIADVSVQPVNPGFDVGAAAQAGYAATITLAASGQQQNLYVEALTVQVGRTLDTFSYQSTDAPISDRVPTAVAASVARLRSALG